MGAAFTPYLPHLGGKAGIFGQLAALLLELIQSWKLVKRPHLELAKIIGIIVVFLAAGELLDLWIPFVQGSYSNTTTVHSACVFHCGVAS